MEYVYLVLVAWLFVGTSFFIAVGQRDGWPRHWKAQHNRDTGWVSVLFIVLPLCLIGGPIWWIAFGAFRIIDDFRARRAIMRYKRHP